MMRGMFAAISGLKQHQVMLDVTANDISNVNTIGYKSSRVTFQDSLTQMQRGAAAPIGQQRRLERRPGRPRRRPRLGRQPDDRRRRADDRQPARRRDPGRRLLPDRRGRPDQRRRRRSPPTAYTRAGNFSINSAGLPDHADRPVRRRLTSRRRAPPTIAIQIPAGATGVAIDQTGGVSYIDPVSQTRVTPVPPDAGHVLERRRPRAHGRQPLGRLGQLRRSRPSTRPGQGGTGVTTAGAVEMSNVDLSQTFTNMITAQRGFQANSRVISTADEMLQDLVNLKR